MEQMPPNVKHIILTNMKVKLCSSPLTFRKVVWQQISWEVVLLVPSLHRSFLNLTMNKNLCGRDGRTICGPQCVPKSTSVTLAGPKRRDRWQRDGRTDRQSDRVRRIMRPPPREEGRIKI